jgi:hypothetical protein
MIMNLVQQSPGAYWFITMFSYSQLLVSCMHLTRPHPIPLKLVLNPTHLCPKVFQALFFFFLNALQQCNIFISHFTHA